MPSPELRWDGADRVSPVLNPGKEWKGRWMLHRGDDLLADINRFDYLNIVDEMITRYWCRLAVYTPPNEPEQRWVAFVEPQLTLEGAQAQVMARLVEEHLGRP